MRRYFLTGCTGFCGREIVRQLLQREDTEYIVCLTRAMQSRHLQHPKLSFFIGDITDCVFPEFDFTDLIHGANEVNDLMQPDQLKYYYTIVEGTNRMLKWAATHDYPPERILVLSSGAVARETLYGRAKRQCEMIARAYGGNTKIARIFSVIGPEMPLNGQYAAGRFVGMALSEKRVRYYGGESVRTYLDVKDCANYLLRMLDDAVPLMPIDVSGEDIVSIKELAHLVAKVFDVPCVKVEGPERIDNYFSDTSTALLLGGMPTLTLTQSLERIHEHYKNRNA